MPTSSEIGRQNAGMDTRGGGVEGKLADRDSHAAGALVTQSQDPLVVGDHDQADIEVGCVAQHRGNVMDVLGRDPETAWVSDDMAIELAGLAHRRGVDDRQELTEVLDQDPVEERFVPVLKCGQSNVFFQVVGLGLDSLELECDLLLDGEPGMRQQAAQAEPVASGREKDASLLSSGSRSSRVPRSAGSIRSTDPVRAS